MFFIVQVNAISLRGFCAVEYVYACDYLNVLGCVYGVCILECEVTNLTTWRLAIYGSTVYECEEKTQEQQGPP